MQRHSCRRALAGLVTAISFGMSPSVLAESAAFPKCARPVATLAVEAIECDLTRCRHSPGEGRGGAHGPGSFLAKKVMQARGEGAMFDLKGSEKKLTTMLVAALKETGCFEVQETASGWESGNTPQSPPAGSARPADYRLSGNITALETKMAGKSGKTSEKINQEAKLSLAVTLHRGETPEAIDTQTLEGSAERVKQNANMFSGYDWSRQAEAGFGETALADVARDVVARTTIHVVGRLAGGAAVVSSSVEVAGGR